MNFKIESMIGKEIHNIEKDDDSPQVLIKDDNLFYCINVHCLFIVRQNNEIVITSNDIIDPSSNDNQFDIRTKELFNGKFYIIEDITINSIGDCTIILSDNIIINILINRSAKNQIFWEILEYDEFGHRDLFKIKT